jgi:predicted TPR repeat methyltransferase
MNIDNLLQQAVSQLQQGQLDGAERGLGRILKKSPKHADANHLLGVIAARRGQYERAASFISCAVKYAPPQPVFFNSLGLAQYHAGHPEQALSAFEQVIRLDPGHVGAHFHYGNIQLGLGRLEAALAAFDRVIQLKPQYAEAYNNRAVVLGGLGRMEDALLSCDQALRINPRHAGAHYNRGNALKSLGRLEEALTAYDQAIQLKPGYAEAYSNCGNTLFDLDRTERAVAAWERTIQLKPGLPEVHHNLGNALIKLGRIDEAIEALGTELRLNPESTSARYLLATLGEADVPLQSPREYVSRLFNDCADKFDKHLVEKLGYRTPQLLFDVVSEQVNNSSDKLDILDLGCGTGLCGVLFSELANTLVGVDLAELMIDKAKERGVYTDFVQADACQAMEQCGRRFDLVLSADVFVYIGRLEEVFSHVGEQLNPDGLFAFSIEVNESGEDYELRQTGRYAHSPGYVQRLAEATGFEILNSNSCTLRYEKGKPVAGRVILLQLRK